MNEKLATPFGKRLADARKEAGYSQPQVSKLVGISQSTLGELERTGKRSGYTPQLASLYGVSATWLATGKGEKRPDGTAKAGYISDRELVQKLCELADTISDKGLRHLLIDAEEYAATYPSKHAKKGGVAA